ncbi:bifunctional demethylmenaquinone methyltransferase/2-methoxy-6-polyprenyl-1,4-benzoquinol methylase UbiE [Anseongella ginsenosidimutans]|nr:bifunctional demethylmenaquinone methyltransferase/2-methoxy-6-polyprenyl-1,4-benzoquinol methylase UbiE [Anseongella ginsenosidimutans]QEC54112.1 bifunctional demethylmenaquinone methyltransferase/2-methoxy-6-polyprenyl-1,4-benzoquinol methylase UbiE [Anseongella ginsenosidimutans]
MSRTVKPYKELATGKKEQVAQMFNNIAGKYDFLNHFLSAGIDRSWRRKAIDELKEIHPRRILDVATGTGDLAFEALRLKPGKITGVDISEGMLAIAREKALKRGVEQIVQLRKADSEKLPFSDNSFDAVTVGFGVRNFENLENGLADMYRVLRPGGKLVVLEFSKPRAFPVKQLYSFYSFKILPFFGRLFSRDKKAYSYLPESVAAFPDGKDFALLMEKGGFRETKVRHLTLGICAIYTGKK